MCPGQVFSFDSRSIKQNSEMGRDFVSCNASLNLNNWLGLLLLYWPKTVTAETWTNQV